MRERSTLSWKGFSGWLVPGPPQLQMLEQQPAPDVVLAANIARPTEVEEVLVDGSQNEPPAGQELAQVRVPRVGELLHLVIAVDDQDQREGPLALGQPDACVERETLRLESPVLAAGPGLEAVEVREEGRGIDRLGLEIRVLGILRPAAVCAAAVEQRRHLIRTGLGWIGGIEAGSLPIACGAELLEVRVRAGAGQPVDQNSAAGGRDDQHEQGNDGGDDAGSSRSPMSKNPDARAGQHRQYDQPSAQTQGKSGREAERLGDGNEAAEGDDHQGFEPQGHALGQGQREQEDQGRQAQDHDPEEQDAGHVDGSPQAGPHAQPGVRGKEQGRHDQSKRGAAPREAAEARARSRTPPAEAHEAMSEGTPEVCRYTGIGSRSSREFGHHIAPLWRRSVA